MMVAMKAEQMEELTDKSLASLRVVWKVVWKGCWSAAKKGYDWVAGSAGLKAALLV